MPLAEAGKIVAGDRSDNKPGSQKDIYAEFVPKQAWAGAALFCANRLLLRAIKYR